MTTKYKNKMTEITPKRKGWLAIEKTVRRKILDTNIYPKRKTVCLLAVITVANIFNTQARTTPS